MNKTLLSIAAACSVFSAAAVSAADAPWLVDFRKADLNDSGGLSRVELDKSRSAQLKSLKDNFKAIDTDGDGHVMQAEYEHYLSKAQDDFAARFRKADLNDSAGLSRREIEKLSGSEFDAMRKNFDAMDGNGDGQVSLTEYRNFQPVSSASAARSQQVTVPRDRCSPDCGVVVDVDRYKIEGEGGLLGTIAGGVAGGLLGNQVGGGTGKTIATVGGAAGGAYAGHQVEKKMKTKKMVKVTVKFDNGQKQDFDYEAETSPFPNGARVQLRDGQLMQYTGP